LAGKYFICVTLHPPTFARAIKSSHYKNLPLRERGIEGDLKMLVEYEKITLPA